MRDPYAPIPTSERWWTRAPARPPALRRRPPDPHEFDPLSLLRPTGDRLGIDRRRRPRGHDASPPPDAELHDVVSAGHVRVRRIVGLIAGGTAPSLLSVVSWCPHGVLACALDPTDRTASSRGRAAAHRAFRALVPELAAGAGSPLFAAGLAVLSRRVVRDLAELAPRRIAVTLVAPRPEGLASRSSPSRVPSRSRIPLRVDGELAPLTDPGPERLAIALREEDALALRRLWLEP